MSAWAPSRRAAGGWLLAAALLALAVALLAAPAGVPLYDGVGFPDEPYRFVSAPPGYQHTKPPTAGRGASGVIQDVNLQAITAQSAEQGPQVVVALSPGRVRVPDGATRVTVTATPLAADRQPAGGYVDGNVYRIAGTATGGTASGPAGVAYLPEDGGGSGGSSGITLRATTGDQPGPVVLYRAAPGDPWRAQRTTRAGTDVYRSAFAGFGDYALAFGVAQPAAAGAARSAGGGGDGGGGVPVGLVVVVVLLVVIGGLLVAIRVSRRKA